MNGTVPNPHYPALFSPVSLGGHTLRNRIIHASIVTKYVVNHAPTEALLNYYRSRAAGGAAAIITEPVAMTAHNRIPSRPRAWDDELLVRGRGYGGLLPRWRRWADHGGMDD